MDNSRKYMVEMPSKPPTKSSISITKIGAASESTETQDVVIDMREVHDMTEPVPSDKPLLKFENINLTAYSHEETYRVHLKLPASTLSNGKLIGVWDKDDMTPPQVPELPKLSRRDQILHDLNIERAM